MNGRISVTSPTDLHIVGHSHHLHQTTTTNPDESSLQSNSNSEDFSDEGIDPSRGLVSIASQPQSKSFHLSSPEEQKLNKRIVLAPSANPTPSAVRNRFKVIPRGPPPDEEDPYGPMAGNFYPGSRPHRSTTPGGGVNVLCDVSNATVTSEPEHYCAYHPNTQGGVGVSSVSHLDLRRPGATSQSGVPRGDVHTTPGRRFISSTMH